MRCAARPKGLIQKTAVPLDPMYLRDKAVIKSSLEEKRSVIRDVEQQVEQLCCKLPFAFSQISAFLVPYKAQIFPEGRPPTFAINGMACSGDSESTYNYTAPDFEKGTTH
jgi:hypothetical protein